MLKIEDALTFTPEHISAFRSLSFDSNPLHISPTYATRTPFGTQVMYGIGSVLAALGLWSRGKNISIKELKVQFKKAVTLNVNYQLFSQQESSSKIILKVMKGEEVYTLIQAQYDESTSHHPLQVMRLKSETNLVELKLKKYNFISDNETLLEKFFFLHSAQIDLNLINFLLWTSYFVGMEHPGEQALYTQLSFKCADDTKSDLAELKITQLTEFKNLNAIALTGSGYGMESFKIQAIKRPKPIDYSLQQVESVLPKNKNLKGKSFFVTGGSRGLGAVIVKALLSLGGKVYTTYRSQDEALVSLRNEVGVENSGRLYSMKIDLSHDSSVSTIKQWFKEDEVKFDYVILNAIAAITPTFFMEQNSNEYLNKFLTFYSIGINSLHASLSALKEGGKVIHISTEYLNKPEPAFSSYISAKSAMEGLLCALAKEQPKSHFINLRLPKMLTDQTNIGFQGSLIHTPTELLGSIIEHID